MNKVTTSDYSLIITPPEEGALAAWEAIKPLMDKLKIANKEAPMDLATRILTNGEAVATAIQQVKDDNKAVYLKGPGITPSDKQMLETITLLEQQGKLNFTLNNKQDEHKINEKVAELRTKYNPQTSENNMAEFAQAVKNSINKIGSPNAKWRDDLEVTLVRGVSDALAVRSTYKPAIWNAETPFETLAMPATKDNTASGIIAGGKMKITYTAADGTQKIIEEKLGDGSSVSLFTSSEKEIASFLEANAEKINHAKHVFHGSKATVISDYDVTQNKNLSNKLYSMGASDKIVGYALEKDKAGAVVKTAENAPQLATGFLIDNVHAILANKAPVEPTLMISLNQSYARTVKDFWDLVKASGGFKAPADSAIVRLSATKDHYKPFQFEGGSVKIEDGNGKEVLSKNLSEGGNALITVLDRGRIKQSIKNVFEDAKNNNKKVIFGFDNSDYYQIARKEVEKISKEYPTVKAEILTAAQAGAKYFTGDLKDTLLVCSNIMGDFLTDIELAGKGTSYSVGTLGDGRKAVELGTGGTAPDLLKKWQKEGVLLFNPMAFVEGLSYGVKYLGELMKRDGVDASNADNISKALEKALYATTDNGIVLPISAGAFTMKDGAKETKVGTHTFVKSVELETLKELKGKHPVATDEAIANAEAELKEMIVKDTRSFEKQ